MSSLKNFADLKSLGQQLKQQQEIQQKAEAERLEREKKQQQKRIFSVPASVQLSRSKLPASTLLLRRDLNRFRFNISLMKNQHCKNRYRMNLMLILCLKPTVI